MTDALKITLKDLRILARDTRALVVLVVMPIIIIAIVGSSTGRLMSKDDQAGSVIRISIDDQDHSQTSQRLVGFLAAAPKVEISTMPSQAAAAQGERTAAAAVSASSLLPNPVDVDGMGVDAVIVIGAEFETKLKALSRSELLAPETGPLREGLSAIDLNLVTAKTANPMLGGLLRLLIKDSLQNAIMPILAEKIPVFRGAARDSVVPKPWVETRSAEQEAVDESDRVYRFVVPSYTVLFVFFLVAVMGRSFILERDMGTLRRLQIAPVSTVAILIGKTLPFFVVSAVQTFVLLLAGRLMFSMSWGPDPWMLVPVVAATSLAATTMGLLFSTMVTTDSQVSAYGNLIVLSTAGISGCLVPREWMPEFTRKISLTTPHAWALDAYRELLARDVPDLSVVWMCCGVLAAFATVFFMLGLLKFRTTN